jgi:hypothetical protein
MNLTYAQHEPEQEITALHACLLTTSLAERRVVLPAPSLFTDTALTP